MVSTDIGIDLGTASILVYIKGKGVVLKEPSVVAFDRDTNKIKAIGEEARLMLGRTPGNIVAVRPLRQGVISDYTVTLYEGVEFQIDIAFSNGAKLHEHLGWETYFTESSPNKTTLEYCNDGPYCQFIIETIPEHK